jgi:hypothetical protein
MFLMSGAIVPGSTYWNLGFGLEKGDVTADEEGLRKGLDYLTEALKKDAGFAPAYATTAWLMAGLPTPISRSQERRSRATP